MATNAQIFSLRLSVKDPFGKYISIVAVDNESARPSSPIEQTLYYIIDKKEYQSYEDGAWSRQDIEMANELMSTYIDLYGETKAMLYVIKDIVRSLGKKLWIAQTNNGSESFVYQNLTTMSNFYKNMMEDLKEDILEEQGASTGFYASTKKPTIGGML